MDKPEYPKEAAAYVSDVKRRAAGALMNGFNMKGIVAALATYYIGMAFSKEAKEMKKYKKANKKYKRAVSRQKWVGRADILSAKTKKNLEKHYIKWNYLSNDPERQNRAFVRHMNQKGVKINSMPLTVRALAVEGLRMKMALHKQMLDNPNQNWNLMYQQYNAAHEALVKSADRFGKGMIDADMVRKAETSLAWSLSQSDPDFATCFYEFTENNLQPDTTGRPEYWNGEFATKHTGEPVIVKDLSPRKPFTDSVLQNTLYTEMSKQPINKLIEQNPQTIVQLADYVTGKSKTIDLSFITGENETLIRNQFMESADKMKNAVNCLRYDAMHTVTKNNGDNAFITLPDFDREVVKNDPTRLDEMVSDSIESRIYGITKNTIEYSTTPYKRKEWDKIYNILQNHPDPAVRTEFSKICLIAAGECSKKIPDQKILEDVSNRLSQLETNNKNIEDLSMEIDGNIKIYSNSKKTNTDHLEHLGELVSSADPDFVLTSASNNVIEELSAKNMASWDKETGQAVVRGLYDPQRDIDHNHLMSQKILQALAVSENGDIFDSKVLTPQQQHELADTNIKTIYDQIKPSIGINGKRMFWQDVARMYENQAEHCAQAKASVDKSFNKAYDSAGNLKRLYDSGVLKINEFEQAFQPFQPQYQNQADLSQTSQYPEVQIYDVPPVEQMIGSYDPTGHDASYTFDEEPPLNLNIKNDNDYEPEF